MKKYTRHLSISLLLIAFVSILISASFKRYSPAPAGHLLIADMAPALLVKLLPGDTNSVPLGINDAEIDIQVTGNIAVTTMTLNFYNDQKTNLEGQFIFPLAEGQTIHYFAMDVNGVMQEGAVVEKQKGREVFEEVERRRVDPGLLEWSKGNNFSARVFPIPSKGYKKIIVAFEQELQANGNSLVYNLPLGFKARVKHFGIKATVSGDAAQPLPMDDNAYMLSFRKPITDWQTAVEYKNIIPDHAIQFQIPVDSKATPVYIEKVAGTADSYYFYALVHADAKSTAKSDPKKLGIIWDVSGSAEARDRDKELGIIKQYLSKIKNVQVEVQAFSVMINGKREFNISGGNSAELIDYLKSFEPDGGTQLGCVDMGTSDREEILFFSDGIHNFGERNIKLPKCPVYTFGTGNGGDYSMLQYISRSTNGRYINASALRTEEILPQLTQTGFNFISATSQGRISQVYPSFATPCNGYFGIAGMIDGKSGSLKLNFGTGNTISQSIDVKIDGAKSTEKTIGRIWAQKKINELEMQSEQNKEQITALGRQFSVITEYTSLIVLEGLDDYVQYGITPPDEKTKKEYDEKIKQSSATAIKTTKDHADKVADDFKKVATWWDTDYKPVYEKAQNPDSISIRGEVVIVAPRQERAMRSESVSMEVVRSEEIRSYDLVRSSSYKTEKKKAKGKTTMSSPNFGGSGNANGDATTGTYYLTVGTKPDAAKNDRSETQALKGNMNLKAWDSKEPYMAELKTATGDMIYKKYLDLKKKYKDMPSYYIDAADYLASAGKPDEAVRVISNLAEIKPDDSRLMRVMAHRLQQWKEYKLATAVYTEVLKMKPEEPQSYRDLGLSYADEQQYQKAVDMLAKVVNRSWDSRFPEIEALTACEINYLVSRSKTPLHLDSLDKRLVKNMPVDIRVVIDWDADNCDIDLWVTDPEAEKCFYGHSLTKAGGRISRDFTRGYGPEEFKLKKALAGKYKVEVNYYGSTQLTLAGPTTIHAQMYTNYGKANEQRKEISLRLTDKKEVVYVGDFEFNK